MDSQKIAEICQMLAKEPFNYNVETNVYSTSIGKFEALLRADKYSEFGVCIQASLSIGGQYINSPQVVELANIIVKNHKSQKQKERDEILNNAYDALRLKQLKYNEK